MTLYLFSIALHLLAVTVWIGHMIFWTLIVGPITKRFDRPEDGKTLRSLSLRRGGLGWPCLVILILTGLYMLYYKGITLGYIVSGDLFKTPFGYLISAKILLVIGMIIYQAFVGHRPAPKLIYADMLAAFLVIGLSILLVRATKVESPYWELKYPSPFLKRIDLQTEDTIKSLGNVKLIIKSSEFERIISRNAHIERLATGFKFTEGPVFNYRGGYLLFSDISADKIYKWIPEIGVSIFRSSSGKSNGLAFDSNGRLIAAEHFNRRISRTEADGMVVSLASNYEGGRLNSPNDLTVRLDGSIYFTDPPFGLIAEHGKAGEKELNFQGVYKLSPDGERLSLILDDFDRPNGIAFSNDEEILYVNDQARMHLMAFDVKKDGTVTNGRIFAKVYGGSWGPDGIKVDSKDNVYSTGPGGIWVWDKKGKELGIILIPEPVSNMNWGDSDRRTLYITASTSLYRVRLNVPGSLPVMNFEAS